jgi:predicted metal-binding membrane protein
MRVPGRMRRIRAGSAHHQSGADTPRARSGLRDRAVVGAGLAGVTVLAWLYLFHMASAMSEMERHAAMGMAMPFMQEWGAVDLLLLFLMWVVMMVAMMLPSAAPMILMFTTIERRRPELRRIARTGIFILGYVTAWTTYSALAVIAQWGLHSAALLSPAMVSTSPYLGGALLIVAGVFQWTPFKAACLTSCRSPLAFLLSEWREGVRGALRMGVRHGIYCVGCCWALMALLFVAGVMNLAWVAGIAAFVLLEKAVPAGDRLGRVAGLVLVVAGGFVMAQAWR